MRSPGVLGGMALDEINANAGLFRTKRPHAAILLANRGLAAYQRHELLPAAQAQGETPVPSPGFSFAA